MLIFVSVLLTLQRRIYAISFIFQNFFHHFEKFYIAVCLLRYSIIGPTTLLATISEKMVNTEGIRIPTWDLKMRARF